MSRARMSRRGFRGKYSPWATMTDEQKRAVSDVCEELDSRGCGWVELRYCAYTGPGGPADRGAVALDTDLWGLIFVEKDGRWR